MRIFVTGGTGQIGKAVVKALLSQGHQVTTLARSDKSAEIQSGLGASPVRGSLTDPSDWVGQALEHEAFIHAAATFESDMGDVDHALVAALIDGAKSLPEDRKIPFLYTGGCWLYPEEPVIPITERHVLDPLPEFEWMLDSIEQLHSCPTFLLTVIHPALVVDQERGTIIDYANSLTTSGEITMIGASDTHYPIIEANDLADIYVRALNHAGDGLLLNATSIKSATAEEIGRLVADKLKKPYQAKIISVEEAQSRLGNWASGYARSQRMNADRARDLLGWEPRLDTIADIVAHCLDGRS